MRFMALTVVDPQGVEWRVGRQWMPWRPRWRKRDSDGDSWWDVGDIGFGDDLLAGILFGIVVAVVVILLLLVIWPVIAIAVEIVIVVLALLLLTALRFTYVLPWTVRAQARDGRSHAWKVKGWGASGAKIEEAAAAIRDGRALPAPGG